jgi:hypothetical protein
MPKITQQAGELDDQMQNFVKPPITTNEELREVSGHDGRDAGHRSAFPVRIADKDKHDSIFQLKKAALEGKVLPAGRPDGPKLNMTLTDEDMHYLKRKQESVELARYHKWLTMKYDLSDPNTRSRLASTGMLDSYFQDREKVIDEMYDTAKDLQKMRLYGPRSKKDNLTCFAIESGRLKVPAHLLRAMNDDLEPNDVGTVARGLFNLKSFYNKKWQNIGLEKDDPLRGIFASGAVEARGSLADDTGYAGWDNYTPLFTAVNLGAGV